MKIRLGFVSNSSSSSFTIMGISIDPDDLLSALKPGIKKLVLDSANGVDSESDPEDWDEDDYEEEEFNCFELIDTLEQIDEGFDFSAAIDEGEGGGDLIIGLGLGAMEETETLAQFRTRATNLLNRYFKASVVTDVNFTSVTHIDG